MKKGYIYSALLGGVFFTVPYLALDIGLAASTAIGIAAYGAGVYISKGKEKNIIVKNERDELNKKLSEAKKNTDKIVQIASNVEDPTLVGNIKEICELSNKIIETLGKKPNNLEQSYNFLNYYLPVTIKILTRYDEIENQELNTKESLDFMKSVEKLTDKIKKAFKEQLNNLYQKDIIDTDAEIKVFEEMLKMDGFVEEIEIKNK